MNQTGASSASYRKNHKEPFMKTTMKRSAMKRASMLIYWVRERGVVIKNRILSSLLIGAALMNPRRQRVFCCAVLAAALSLGASRIVKTQQCLVSTIAFTSNRDAPTSPQQGAFEIYLMNPDGTNVRRLTDNTDGEAFPNLSPDGKRIVFESNRDNALEVPPQVPLNIGDLFLMNDTGNGQTRLTRGSSASWSPDGKYITFHRSASGLACPVSVPPPYPGIPGCPVSTTPGAATWDSDIFIAKVGDLLDNEGAPINITNSPTIDDDPDWSPDGKQIAFISHDVTDNQTSSTTAEIYVLDIETGHPTRLTFNNEEERAPAWSPDGTRIVFMCRKNGPDFEICVMNADGSGQAQLTNNTVDDGTPTFSPLDGQKILFHRGMPSPTGPTQQLWTMN